MMNVYILLFQTSGHNFVFLYSRIPGALKGGYKHDTVSRHVQRVESHNINVILRLTLQHVVPVIFEAFRGFWEMFLTMTFEGETAPISLDMIAFYQHSC